MDTIRSLILSPLLGGPPYLAFASLLTGCCIGFPFSSDITLITGGVLAGTGIFELRATICIALASILTGDSIAFFMGRRFGHKIVRSRLFARLCPPERFAEISRFLNQNASKFIFMVRFTPGARSVIFLTAGTVGVRPATFYKMNILSTSLYVPALISIAYLAANNADLLIAEFQAYSRILSVVLVASVVGFLWYRRRRMAAARSIRES